MKQTVIDIVMAVFMIALVALLIGLSDGPGRPQAQGGEVPAPPAPVPPASQPLIHFAKLDVFIDPQGAAMAAYQIEIVPHLEAGGHTSYISLSAGDLSARDDHKAFSAKGADANIWYDVNARGDKVRDSRLIIAALSTDDDLPKKKTRVAQIDVEYTGEIPPKFTVASSLVCTPAAGKIDSAAVTLELIDTVRN